MAGEKPDKSAAVVAGCMLLCLGKIADTHTSTHRHTGWKFSFQQGLNFSSVCLGLSVFEIHALKRGILCKAMSPTAVYKKFLSWVCCSDCGFKHCHTLILLLDCSHCYLHWILLKIFIIIIIFL